MLWLMTIPGVDATAALLIVAAVGDFAPFRTLQAVQLASHHGMRQVLEWTRDRRA
jgi:hypothetical protein